MSHLSEETFATALAELAAQDLDLARIMDILGLPPFFVRDPGFSTLILLILEQQVSLASARVAYDKLAAIIGEVTPHWRVPYRLFTSEIVALIQVDAETGQVALNPETRNGILQKVKDAIPQQVAILSLA